MSLDKKINFVLNSEIASGLENTYFNFWEDLIEVLYDQKIIDDGVHKKLYSLYYKAANYHGINNEWILLVNLTYNIVCSTQVKSGL